MFDIGLGEWMTLAFVGLVIVGPDKLPQYAAQAARLLRGLRGQVTDARRTLIDAAALDPQTLADLRDLDPRRVLSGTADELNTAASAFDRAGRASQAVEPASTPLDPDTT